MNSKLIRALLFYPSFLVACGDDEKPFTMPDYYHVYIKGNVCIEHQWIDDPVPVKGIRVTLVPHDFTDPFDLRQSSAITDASGKFEVRVVGVDLEEGSFSLMFEDIDGEENGYFEDGEWKFKMTDAKPLTIHNILSSYMTVTWVMVPKEIE